jgi:hypothetical protein
MIRFLISIKLLNLENQIGYILIHELQEKEGFRKYTREGCQYCKMVYLQISVTRISIIAKKEKENCPGQEG